MNLQFSIAMKPSPRILFVSNEIPDDVTRRTLEKRGFVLTMASDFEGARGRLAKSEINLVIVDLMSADSTNGGSESGPPEIAFIRHLRETETTKAVPVLVVGEWGTGQPTLALSQGADAYERTPIDAERLATSIERLLTEPRLVGAAAGWSE